MLEVYFEVLQVHYLSGSQPVVQQTSACYYMSKGYFFKDINIQTGQF